MKINITLKDVDLAKDVIDIDVKFTPPILENAPVTPAYVLAEKVIEFIKVEMNSGPK